MSTVRYLLDCFWTPKVWLPPNITWADLVSNDEIRYTNHNHLYYPLPLALGLLVLRYLLESHVFAPFGLYLGIKNSKPKRAPQNDVLEKSYRLNNKMKYKDVMSLAKQTDMSERQVERWLRLRRAQEKPSTLVKFCENGWRATYYTYSFTYGLWCLWDKPWLWDIDEAWRKYPHHNLTDDVWWYYMISLSFYWSLAMSQFTDVKRKDFWQMCIHHIATISLMSFSWVCNMTRLGTLVLLLHDCADIFVELAKMAKYSKYQKLCDTLFAIFTILWLITRIILYPSWILYCTTIKAPIIVQTMFPAYYIFNGLLLLLLVLHIYWTHLILKIAYTAISAGQMERDIRSSSDELTDASTSSANNAKLKAH